MPNLFGHAKFLSAAVGLSLVICGASAASAAGVTRWSPQGFDASLHASPVGARHLSRARVPRRRAPQNCTTVQISQNVQYDLEEPTQQATAAMVMSTGQQLTKFNVDGTGCDIGIYIPVGTQNVTISDGVVHDATRAGIVADTANAVTLFGLGIYNVGDHTGGVYTPDGVQYGFDVDVDSTTNATVQNVNASQYQKEGFLVYNATGALTNDQAIGSGPIDYIASNGFELNSSELSALTNNVSMLNQYTGQYYGGSGYILCDVTVNGVLITPSLGTHQHLGGNQSLFNDIPYYISQSPTCQ